ncbi:MAG: hypothetical protein GX489_08815 [Firmicutes bacterium]|nr:hypothetical protein [Bacillota bacterium]
MTLEKYLSPTIVLLLLISLAGCQPTTPNPNQNQETPGLAPDSVAGFPHLKETARLALPSGDIRWISPKDISLDGNQLAIIANDNQYETLWIYSLANQEGKSVYSIPAAEVSAGRLVLITVDWTKDDKLVFARQGTQPDGTHEGKRGLLLLTADPESGTTQELSWLPNPESYIKQILLNRESDLVLVHMGDTLWQVPLSGASTKVVRTDLPRYDGLFFLQPSPEKAKFVYELFEPEKRGIYLLDVSTGTETCLAKAGDTFSFSPQWSPDGQHIAFYTADTKSDAPAPGEHKILAEQYDIVEGEDAPAPIASTIEVVTVTGQKITGLTVPGRKVGRFTWASDGKHLAFLSTEDATAVTHEYLGPVFEWHSLYMADLTGNITKIADIPEGTLDVTILTVLDNKAYYLTYSEKETALWLAQAGQEPKKLELPAGVPVSETGTLVPLYPQSVLADSLFLTYISQNKSYYLQVWQDQVNLLAEDSLDSSLVAAAKDKVILTSTGQGTHQSGQLTIFILEQ